MPQALKDLKINKADGKVTGWKEGVTYFYQAPGQTNYKRLQENKKDTAFAHGTKLALSNKPKQNEVLIINTTIAVATTTETSLQPESIIATEIGNNALPNQIVAGTGKTQEEQRLKKRAELPSPISAETYFPDSSRKKSEAINTFASQWLNPKNNEYLTNQPYAVQKTYIKQVTDQLTSWNKIPSKVVQNTNGSYTVEFNGSDLKTKAFLWLFNRRIHTNEKNSYLAWANDIQKSMQWHIADTDREIYTHELPPKDVLIQEDLGVLKAQTSLEYNTRASRATNQRLWILQTSIYDGYAALRANKRNDESQKNVINTAQSTLESKLWAFDGRVKLLIERIDTENTLLISMKQYSYLNGREVLTDTEIKAKLESLRADINAVDRQLSSQIDPSLVSKYTQLKPQIMVAQQKVTDLESTMNVIPTLDLTTKSQAIAEQQAIISASQATQSEYKDRLQQFENNHRNKLDKDYIHKKTTLEQTIDDETNKIQQAHTAIDTIVWNLRTVASSQSNQVTQQFINDLIVKDLLLTPLVDGDDVLMTKIKETEEKYNDKQSVENDAIKTQEDYDSRKSTIEEKRPPINERMSEKKSDYQQQLNDIKDLEKEIQEEMNKQNSTNEKIDIQKVFENQKKLQDLQVEQSKTIDEYNRAHYDQIVTYQEEMYLDLQKIQEYQSSTQQDRDHATKLHTEISSIITQKQQLIEQYIWAYKDLTKQATSETNESIPYAKKQLNELEQKIKDIYQELTGNSLESLQNYNNFNNPQQESLLDKQQQRWKHVTLLNNQLDKWWQLINKQQSHINLIGLQSQSDMLTANKNHWNIVLDKMNKNITTWEQENKKYAQTKSEKEVEKNKINPLWSESSKIAGLNQEIDDIQSAIDANQKLIEQDKARIAELTPLLDDANSRLGVITKTLSTQKSQFSQHKNTYEKNTTTLEIGTSAYKDDVYDIPEYKRLEDVSSQE